MTDTLFDRIHKPLRLQHRDVPFRRVPYEIEKVLNADLNPPYQRSHVWTDTQASKFVGFVLQGGEPPPIIINLTEKGWTSKDTEVLDGKQRLTSIIRFLDNSLPATLYDGSDVFVDNFKSCEISWRKLGMSIFVKFGFCKLNKKDTLKHYLRLNNGGTTHTEDEINHVRKLLEDMND